MTKKEVDFARPPLVEVVLDLQFKPIKTGEGKDFASKDFADVYNLFHSNNTEYSEVAPLQENPESFSNDGFGFSFGLINMPEHRRQWFASKDGSKLLQFQPNRLVANWRAQTGQDYIEYEKLKGDYVKDFEKLQKFFEASNGKINVVHAEITYINHIPVDKALNFDEMFAKVFNSYSSTKHHDGLEVTGISWADSYSYTDDSFRGGLIVTKEALIKQPENLKMIASRLSFRGVVKKDATLVEYLKLLDKGHSVIVNTFCDITTKEMHAIWGKK